MNENESSASQPEAKRYQRSAKKRNRQPWPSLAKPTPVLDYSRENARFDGEHYVV